MDIVSVRALQFNFYPVTVYFVTEFVSSHVLIKQDRLADVWLGGQDIVEGKWKWTNAGNQALSNDLLWAPGNHYFINSQCNTFYCFGKVF